MEDTSGDKDNYIDKYARQLDGTLLTFVLQLKVETDLLPFVIKQAGAELSQARLSLDQIRLCQT